MPRDLDPVPSALAAFQAARQRFLAALDAMLTDPALDDLAVDQEAQGTVSAIQQLVALRRG